MQCAFPDRYCGARLCRRLAWLAVWLVLAALAFLPRPAGASNEFGVRGDGVRGMRV
ncbi:MULTISPECIES: hypothetical protein [Cupriavidus]|uniref:hypothetical protein n=1 Tax=Cupriavidus TaxID=106589 RepID=UPI000379B82F|nr:MULTISPECIES: hypothetical protein [Cupriavidus]